MIPVLVSAYAPFPKTISLCVEDTTPLEDLHSILRNKHGVPLSTRLTLQDGHSLPSQGTVASLANKRGQQEQQHAVLLRLSVKLCGGKGGFGSQLRAAGGRMASRNRNGEQNNGSCRDLNGRRLSSVKEAAKVAAYVESAPEREKKLKEAQQAKLEALQKEVKRLDNKVNGESSQASGSGSNLGKRSREQEEFVEQAKEAVDNVRGALAAAMLKKKKKQAEAKAKNGAATTSDMPPPAKKVALEIPSPSPTAGKAVAASA